MLSKEGQTYELGKLASCVERQTEAIDRLIDCVDRHGDRLLNLENSMASVGKDVCKLTENSVSLSALGYDSSNDLRTHLNHLSNQYDRSQTMSGVYRHVVTAAITTVFISALFWTMDAISEKAIETVQTSQVTQEKETAYD